MTFRFSLFAFRSLRNLLIFAGLISCIASTSLAQTWTIQLADFSQKSGEILSADAAGVRVRVGGQEQLLSLDAFLSADRGDAARAQPAKFELRLSGGDVVAGEPAGIRGETLAWRHPLAGEMNFPLRHVASMARWGTPLNPADAPEEDTVTLGNGDVVAGIISDLTASQLTIATPDAADVPIDSVAIVRFATPGEGNRSTARIFRLRIVPESIITVDEFSVDAKRVRAGIDGMPFSFDRSALLGIEQINGPVSWLSTRPPSEILYTPYLDLQFPPRMDRTVTGDPLRFGGRTFAHGIGVHAYTRIAWPLDGSYQKLRLQYAIDGDRPQADVHVRVLVDGKLVHEQASVRSGSPSAVLTFDVAAAKSVTLEVDYGAGFDVQDRFLWIEPALLRTPPNEGGISPVAPTTQGK